MNEISDRTALVTGANSGIGFEAAAQLAEAGWGKVILACRSVAKGEEARTKLKARTKKDPFDVLAVDTSEVASTNAASDQLRERGDKIDFLLLNAGATAAQPRFNSDGVEITWVSTLVGHHVMTMRLLADGVLGSGARIVITRSEGSRGNMPGMQIHDIEKVAKDAFDGDRAAAIDALAHIKGPYEFFFMNEYVTAKMVVAWWAAALARRLPAGMTVNAVSPGGVVSTGFSRGMRPIMRIVMTPMLLIIGSMMGMNGPVGPAASRYLDAADFGDENSGNFYATAHRKKLIGPMGLQAWPEYFADQASQEAGFDAVVKMTGVGFPA